MAAAISSSTVASIKSTSVDFQQAPRGSLRGKISQKECLGLPICVKPSVAFQGRGQSRVGSVVVANASPAAQPAVTAPAPAFKGIAASNALLRFGFPKGSLQQSTHDLFHRAGYNVEISERGYFPRVDDPELQLVLFRSQEISRYVEDGILDAGICGYDWIVENESDVHIVCELQYSKNTSAPARWVLAVPEDSPIQTVADLTSGGLVASELVKTTRKFFLDKGLDIKVEYSWGATEVKALLPGVQGIVDITETGSSLRANKLRIVDTILASTTRLVANKASWKDPAKRRKIEDLKMQLCGALLGRGKVGLKANVSNEQLQAVIALLPSELSPTVSQLADPAYSAVEVICDSRLARDLVPMMKRIGASGIFTYPLDIVVH
eukprot:jgi/Mesvir1/18900/Mv18897-RA.1